MDEKTSEHKKSSSLPSCNKIADSRVVPSKNSEQSKDSQNQERTNYSGDFLKNLQGLLPKINKQIEQLSAITNLVSESFKGLNIFTNLAPTYVSKDVYEKCVSTAKEVGLELWSIHPESVAHLFAYQKNEIISSLKEIMNNSENVEMIFHEIEELMDEGYRFVIRESKDCYNYKLYRSCFMLIVSQIDHSIDTLATSLKIQSSHIEKRRKQALGKVVNEFDIHVDDIDGILLWTNITSALEELCRWIPFETYTEKFDSDHPSRHVLMHGYSKRVFTKEDCDKALTLLYGIEYALNDRKYDKIFNNFFKKTVVEKSI